MTAADFSNRVPLQITCSGTKRTMAAIPTDVPGLFVNWDPVSRSYAISHHAGTRVATGFASISQADMAADLIADYADWRLASQRILDMPWHQVMSIASTLKRHGGYLFGADIIEFCNPAVAPSERRTGIRRGWKSAEARQLLLDTIRRERGEWTTGRVKALYRKALPTHVWRATIRRDLRALHAAGHLTLHEAPGRRFFFTYNPRGGERP